MITILLINLRSIPAVGMVLVVIICSLLAMLGFMGWAYRFTGSDKFLFAILNTTMPIILLTIANSDGVHVMTKFFREIRKNKNVDVAIASNMDALLVPIFITSITTIAAFLTMGLSPPSWIWSLYLCWNYMGMVFKLPFLTFIDKTKKLGFYI